MELAIPPETTVADAGARWLRRLEQAGLDAGFADDPFDDNDNAGADDYDNQRHFARQTIAAYRRALDLYLRFLARLGRRTVAELQPDDLVQYARLLRRRSYDLSLPAARAIASGEPAERLSARTIHGYTRPMLGFYVMLELAGALPFRAAVVALEMKRALPRLPETHAPTPPDLRRLVTIFDRAPAEESEAARLMRLRNAALLHLLFSSGARISEALGLNVGDAVRDRRVLAQVQIQGKGRQAGALFVRRHAERALAAYLAARGWPPASEPLFVSLDRRTAGHRLTRSSGWRIVNGAAVALAARIELEGKRDEAALLRETSPHTFRHFVGYHLLNEGVDLAEVSQILRHRSVEVTRTYYARYREVQLQEVHDQFSADPLGE